MTTHPDLLGTALVYTCDPMVVIHSAPVHSRRCPDSDDEWHGHQVGRGGKAESSALMFGLE